MASLPIPTPKPRQYKKPSSTYSTHSKQSKSSKSSSSSIHDSSSSSSSPVPTRRSNEDETHQIDLSLPVASIHDYGRYRGLHSPWRITTTNAPSNWRPEEYATPPPRVPSDDPWLNNPKERTERLRTPMWKDYRRLAAIDFAPDADQSTKKHMTYYQREEQEGEDVYDRILKESGMDYVAMDVRGSNAYHLKKRYERQARKEEKVRAEAKRQQMKSRVKREKDGRQEKASVKMRDKENEDRASRKKGVEWIGLKDAESGSEDGEHASFAMDPAGN